METNNKLREALKKIRKAMILDSGCGPTSELHAVVDSITQTALAEPVRNYEVGTAKEQTERFGGFCRRDYVLGECPADCPLSCPLSSLYYLETECPLAWAQLPYEGGAK